MVEKLDQPLITRICIFAHQLKMVKLVMVTEQVSTTHQKITISIYIVRELWVKSITTSDLEQTINLKIATFLEMPRRTPTVAIHIIEQVPQLLCNKVQLVILGTISHL